MVNTASSTLTGTANTWFAVWAIETIGELNWEALHHTLKGKYQGCIPGLELRVPVAFCQTYRHCPETPLKTMEPFY